MDIWIPLIGGLALLIAGAELLVRGAVRLAEGMGVSSLLIGLTIVGFGTSTPELVTSVEAALLNSPGIAVGNIVGSNIFNILIILGASALICPIAVSSTALRRDGSWVIGTALLMALVGVIWTLDRFVAAALLVLLTVYLVRAWRQERRVAPGGNEHTAIFEKAEALEQLDPGLRPAAMVKPKALGWVLPLGLCLGGLALLVFGASNFVTASVELARLLGVSETVIGLTIVAAGTSMPELATSTIAALRKQADVAIGNVLGSNIYNVLGIGGVTALIAPTAVPAQIAGFDSWVMVGVSILLLLLLWTGRRLSRLEGACLIAGYVAYVWWIWPK